ncbi:hypothetical protein BVC80_1591g42 [Macleaya cordata]|uniref:Uncharacterized protein n=1 Tax=Macleaya cordata TaxID=56857 RepID=A0A200QI47_MACCD|nr:hypothetical protein BVC80_1591g42 [Macleaya cordata]
MANTKSLFDSAESINHYIARYFIENKLKERKRTEPAAECCFTLFPLIPTIPFKKANTVHWFLVHFIRTSSSAEFLSPSDAEGKWLSSLRGPSIGFKTGILVDFDEIWNHFHVF